VIAPDPRFVGKQLPESRFAGDDGSADPGVARALTAWADGSGDLYAVERALLGTRLLVPTGASADEVERDERTGHHVEKISHLSVVTFQSSAGWSGLLAFTCVDAVVAWDPAARPVPVTATEAAVAALEEDRSVLVLDLAGPHRLALGGTLLRALATGRAAVPPIDDPDVHTALDAALAPLRASTLTGWQVEPSADSDLTVVLHVAAGQDPVRTAESAAALLVDDPVIRDRCERGIGFGVATA
jgi:hypothetical protein